MTFLEFFIYSWQAYVNVVGREWIVWLRLIIKIAFSSRLLLLKSLLHPSLQLELFQGLIFQMEFKRNKTVSKAIISVTISLQRFSCIPSLIQFSIRIELLVLLCYFKCIIKLFEWNLFRSVESSTIFSHVRSIERVTDRAANRNWIEPRLQSVSRSMNFICAWNASLNARIVGLVLSWFGMIT